MKKKCKIIIAMVFLFQVGIESAYSSFRRFSLGEMICEYHFSAYHLGTFSEFVSDSTATFGIIKSSKNDLNKITINYERFRISPLSPTRIGEVDIDDTDIDDADTKKAVFYVFMTSDSTNFVFGFKVENKDKALEIFNIIKEFKRIRNLTDIDKKIIDYKNWLFSLIESECWILRWEGYNEWEYGRRGIAEQYARAQGLLDDIDENIPIRIWSTVWSEVYTESDYRRLFDILLSIEYPTFIEWRLIGSFQRKYTFEVKSYVYNFFKRYSENFDKIQFKGIITSPAFRILRSIETNEEILEIITEYDNSKWYLLEAREILETYINPIIEQINKNLR